MANTAGPQVGIGNGQTLNADAARYWLALVAAIYVAHGFTIVATEGTRNYARQRDLYQGWVQRRDGFNPAWSPDSPYAYHLSGRAVDVGSRVGYLATAESKAFYALAGLYGFRPTVKGETWHFEWRAEWVGISLEAAKHAPRTIPTPKSQEDDMPLAVRATQNGIVPAGTKLLVQLGKSHDVAQATLDVYGIDARPVDNATLKLVLRDHNIPEKHARNYDVVNAVDTKHVSYLGKIAEKLGTKLR